MKIFLQPGASLDTANAQVVAAGGFVQRFLPPGIQPPEIINFSASSVPILQLGLSGEGMSEQQLNDLALNFLRTQLISVPGVVDSSSLRRKAAAGHGQHESEPDAGKGRFALGCAECGKCPESNPSIGHSQSGRKRTGRAHECFPAHSAGLNEYPNQTGG